MKESRRPVELLPPGRTKFITAKKLSKKLEKEQVLTALSQNIQLATAIQPACEQKPDKIRKLVDIQANVAAGKGIGYERWAKKFNLKRWSQTLCLLQEKKLLSEDALNQRIVELKTQHDDALGGGQRLGCPHGLPQGAARGILWSIGSTSLLHRSSRLCGTPQRSGSNTVQSLPCTRPLAPISRPTAQDTARPQKAGC